MPESVDPLHLLLIGAGPGVGAGVVRRFGREGFRSTLISRGQGLEQLAAQLRGGGLEIEPVVADIEDLDGYRAALEGIFGAPGAPGVAVYNAALPDPGEILDTTIGRLRTAYAVDVLGAVVAAQVAAPVLRTAGTGTLLFTSGGFADHPVPALASLSIGKAALRSAATFTLLVYLHRWTENNRTHLKLVNPSVFVHEMLTRTHLNCVFDISSLHDALTVLCGRQRERERESNAATVAAY